LARWAASETGPNAYSSSLSPPLNVFGHRGGWSPTLKFGRKRQTRCPAEARVSPRFASGSLNWKRRTQSWSRRTASIRCPPRIRTRRMQPRAARQHGWATTTTTSWTITAASSSACKRRVYSAPAEVDDLFRMAQRPVPGRWPSLVPGVCSRGGIPGQQRARHRILTNGSR
jgi:hypothetical protein